MAGRRGSYRPAATAGLLLMAACAAAGPTPGGPRDSAVRYTGEITAEANRRLFESAPADGLERLVISSRGGDVEAGIALGRWVHDRRLEVEVADYCLSSCANYVFTAGTRRIIRPGAVVGWHGSYTHLAETGQWTDDITWRMEAYGEDRAVARRNARRLVDRLVRLERTFFEQVGVDGYICWVGKMPPYRAPDYFTLSVTDMARFRVTHVMAPPGYPHGVLDGLDVDLIRIDLGQKD